MSVISITPVMRALEAYLNIKCGDTFPTIGRKLKNWTDVSDQPALFLRRNGGKDEWTGTVVHHRAITVQAWIYASFGEDDIPDEVLDTAELSLRTALEPDAMGNPVVLRDASGNQLCHFARIEGDAEYYPGDAGKQAVAIIPISILLP